MRKRIQRTLDAQSRVPREFKLGELVYYYRTYGKKNKVALTKELRATGTDLRRSCALSVRATALVLELLLGLPMVDTCIAAPRSSLKHVTQNSGRVDSTLHPERQGLSFSQVLGSGGNGGLPFGSYGITVEASGPEDFHEISEADISNETPVCEAPWEVTCSRSDLQLARVLQHQ